MTTNRDDGCNEDATDLDIFFHIWMSSIELRMSDSRDE